MSKTEVLVAVRRCCARQGDSEVKKKLQLVEAPDAGDSFPGM